MRRTLHERSIGHTGTLDPMASGLLPLVIGRATRLSSHLTGHDKTYAATIRLGLTTDTDDAVGQPTHEERAVPSAREIEAALSRFRGTFEQRPPAHSAKKVGGVKAYDIARKDKPVELAPVSVTVRALEWRGRSGDEVEITLTATAGFYVRALARDLGAVLGCGGHLTALRRLAIGSYRLEDALTLAEAERATAEQLKSRLIAPADALPDLPMVVLTPLGLARALHGNWLAPIHVEGGLRPLADSSSPPPALFRLQAAVDGRLVGLARMRGGALHPVVVLG
jgi:tRNA pseudouridine55 synthase